MSEANELAEALAGARAIELLLDPAQAFIVVAAVQLALRHPDFTGDSAIEPVLRDFIDNVGQELGPGLGALIARGDDRAQDVAPELTARHALYCGWVAGLASKHGIAVRWVDDEQGNHTDRLRLPFIDEHVTVDLIVPPPPEDWRVDEGTTPRQGSRWGALLPQRDDGPCR